MSAHEDNDSELWMVPFADLMTTLVILFLAMYGFASMKNEEQQKADEQKAKIIHEQEIAVTVEQKAIADAKEKEAKLAAELEKAVQEKLPKSAAAVRVDGDRIQLTLSSPLLFDSGSDELRPDIGPFLEKLADALKPLANQVLVEGHTDTIKIHSGRFPTNWELSAARATAVIEDLEKRGLRSERLAAYGYGQFRPVDTNRTRAGRQKNRRIEISLLRMTS